MPFSLKNIFGFGSTTPAPAAPTAPVAAPAPVAPVVAPAPAALTAEQVVDVALANLLRKDNVEALWKEKVTDRSNVITRLFGRIAYLWGKSAALKKDQVAIDFSNKCSKLVDAVYKRDIAPAERGTVMGEGRPVIKQTLAEADASLIAQRKADKKLNEFYSVFRERVTQLNGETNGEVFAAYTKAAQKLISDVSTQKATQFKPKSTESQLLDLKVPTVQNEFAQKLFADVVNSYAKKPLAEITPDSFKATIALLKSIFGKTDTVMIEMELRNAIGERDSTEFANAINANSKPENVNAKIAELINLKKAGSDREIAMLEQELRDIDQDITGTPMRGTLHIAYLAIEAAQAAIVEATQAFNDASTATLGAKSTEEVLSMPIGPSMTNLLRLQEVVKQKKDALVNAEQTFAAIKARREQITGGELDALKMNNDDDVRFEESARKDILKLSLFYAELAKEVSETYAGTRSKYLHEIIG